MTTFEPLTIQRAIRDDGNLTATQKHLLHVAALRADNSTGKVRASLELLAKDAGYARKSAGRAFSEPAVVRYFARIDRQTRATHLWFHLPTRDTESPVIGDTASPVADDSGLSVHDPGHRVPPSASTSATSKQEAPEEPSMDDADWLAAELDADPAHCQAAIDHKRQQAADRGNPWRSTTHMVRKTIPLDEWRPLVQQCKPQTLRKPSITGVCGTATCPGVKHTVETDHHLLTCFG